MRNGLKGMFTMLILLQVFNLTKLTWRNAIIISITLGIVYLLLSYLRGLLNGKYIK